MCLIKNKVFYLAILNHGNLMGIVKMNNKLKSIEKQLNYKIRG